MLEVSLFERLLRMQKRWRVLQSIMQMRQLHEQQAYQSRRDGGGDSDQAKRRELLEE